MNDVNFQYFSNTGQMFENHFHNEIEIYFLIKGQRYYFINNETHLVMPRNLVIIKENLPHKVFSAGYSYYERYLLNIKKDFITHNFSNDDASSLLNILDEDKFVYRLKDPSAIESVFHKMHSAGLSNNKDTAKAEMLNSYTIELLSEISASLSSSDSTASDIVYVNKNILQIADYINNHYTDKLTLSDISDKFHLSKFYLCKLFKKSLGYTFSDFLNNVRVMEARKLLETTKISVSDISSQIGYSDIAYFCRVFKNIMGVSALQYRKNTNK